MLRYDRSFTACVKWNIHCWAFAVYLLPVGVGGPCSLCFSLTFQSLCGAFISTAGRSGGAWVLNLWSFPSADATESSPLNLPSMSAEQKMGITQLSLQVINIHQRLPHLTLHSTPEVSEASAFCKLTLFILRCFCASDLCLIQFKEERRRTFFVHVD